MRLTDADWIVRSLKRWQGQLIETYGKNDEYVLCIGKVLMKIDDAPTADAVEIVRCKDCYYAIPYNERWTLPKKNNCMWCKRYEDVRSLDWFCADGERG